MPVIPAVAAQKRAPAATGTPSAGMQAATTVPIPAAMPADKAVSAAPLMIFSANDIDNLSDRKKNLTSSLLRNYKENGFTVLSNYP
jgi:hypothetical protein